MRIDFYAPLKSPAHPIPSGDRQMARLLIAALRGAGHQVEIASELRSFFREPDKDALSALRRTAQVEADAIERRWLLNGKPDLWLCYHPYYKSPDLLGPQLARQFEIPYVTIEASYAGKRQISAWEPFQSLVVEAVRDAALNICFTERDRAGLAAAVQSAPLADLPPFIDAPDVMPKKRSGLQACPVLIAVAMMRSGDKMRSFLMLARALRLIVDLPWQLVILGDGPCRSEIEEAFGDVLAPRTILRGEVPPEAVAGHLAEADIYVWPGCGEAYGLAYLEAQAMALPVVAQNTAGVPAVVAAGETGILTPDADVEAFAAAIRQLLCDSALRCRLAEAGCRLVRSERTLAAASRRLDDLLVRVRKTASMGLS